MALNAVLLVVLFANPMNRLVRVVAGAARHLAVRSKVALAAEHSDRLESSKRVGVISELLLGDTTG